MKKLSETMYSQENGTMVLHKHGSCSDVPWVLVDTGQDPLYSEAKVLAMFAEEGDALTFAGLKEIDPSTWAPGRTRRVSDDLDSGLAGS